MITAAVVWIAALAVAALSVAAIVRTCVDLNNYGYVRGRWCTRLRRLATGVGRVVPDLPSRLDAVAERVGQGAAVSLLILTISVPSLIFAALAALYPAALLLVMCALPLIFGPLRVVLYRIRCGVWPWG